MAIPRPGIQFTGDFNSVGRGSRVQQGVDYFSAPELPNINEAPSTVGAFDEGSPGAGLYPVPLERIGGDTGVVSADAWSNMQVGDQARAAVDGTRDSMLGMLAKGGLGLLGGPAGVLGVSNPLGAMALNKGAEFLIDRAAAPDDNAEQMGANAAAFAQLGMPEADAANLAVESERTLPGMSYERQARENDRALQRAMAEMAAEEATAAARARSAAAQTAGGVQPRMAEGGSGHDLGSGALGMAPGVTTSEFGTSPMGTSTGSYTDNVMSDVELGGGMADGGMVSDRPVGLSTPGYADGGLMEPKGPMLAMGFMDGGMMGAQPDAQQIDAQVNQILRDPQVRQQLVARAQQLMQTGELTPEEVTTLGRVAEAAMFNPALYPQLRQFVAQQGMSPLPPTFDPMTIVKILAVSRALSGAQQAPGAPGMQMGQGMPGGATPPGQVPPTSQATMNPPPGMADGGVLRGPGTGRSDSIGTVNESNGQPVKVANGEYVIPEHVVRAKGRDFFDKMLRQYADVPKGD